jgi:hypothetical protein
LRSVSKAQTQKPTTTPITIPIHTNNSFDNNVAKKFRE